MEDWLATFGTFQSNLPAGLGAGDYFLPTNRKSLVVSHLLPLARSHHMIVFALFYRYPFSQRELFLGRFSHTQWET